MHRRARLPRAAMNISGVIAGNVRGRDMPAMTQK
jgi:hypothetical protein